MLDESAQKVIGNKTYRKHDSVCCINFCFWICKIALLENWWKSDSKCFSKRKQIKQVKSDKIKDLSNRENLVLNFPNAEHKEQ